MTSVSVLVPILNEEDNVVQLFTEIKDVCEAQGYRYEILFIDDGSTDHTPQRVRSLSPLTYIRLRKNFGQTAAMDAGIHAAQYEYIVTMDGDLQNDPKDIPRLIEKLEAEELDIVSGWRKHRKDTFMKRFTSRGANVLRGILLKDNIHDSGCSLKVYRRECFEGLTLYGEMHRFIPAILLAKGYRVGEIVVSHRPRVAGRTKYNWRRTLKGFVDMISLWFWEKYTSRPMHLFGPTGLVFLLGGFVCGIVSISQHLTRGKVGDTAWPILTAFLLITGVQFFVFGLMMDIQGKTYRKTTGDLSYSIKSIEKF